MTDRFCMVEAFAVSAIFHSNQWSTTIPSKACDMCCPDCGKVHISCCLLERVTYVVTAGFLLRNMSQWPYAWRLMIWNSVCSRGIVKQSKLSFSIGFNIDSFYLIHLMFTFRQQLMLNKDSDIRVGNVESNLVKCLGFENTMYWSHCTAFRGGVPFMRSC